MFRDDLPDYCPPQAAVNPSEGTVVYRIVKAFPATGDDFLFKRTEKPTAKFKDIPECYVRGLSVFVSRGAAEAIVKSDRWRHLDRMVGKMSLGPMSGMIFKDGTSDHRIWWPFAAFDPISACSEPEE